MNIPMHTGLQIHNAHNRPSLAPADPAQITSVLDRVTPNASGLRALLVLGSGMFQRLLLLLALLIVLRRRARPGMRPGESAPSPPVTAPRAHHANELARSGQSLKDAPQD